MAMKISIKFLLSIAAAAIFGTSALAQTALSSNDIIESLQNLEAAPPGITAIALRQQALERIRNHQAENPLNREPLSEQLNRLPQFTVEITFNFDSAVIRPESYRTVGRIADALHHPFLLGYKVLIVGHTDATGKRSYNLDLSQRRADAIREVLVTTFGISPQRVEAAGLGEEQLRDSADPKSPANRRVQLITIGKLN
jgi:outer membrane protein OmpA-like peptidoglycan-associated protein